MRPPHRVLRAVFCCLSTIIVGSSITPGLVRARQIIVAKTGGEFTTIAAAVAIAQPGDVVTVRSGVYNEAIVFPRSGTATAFITLQGEGAILDGTGLSGQGVVISSRNYIRVVGMTVRNWKSGDTPMGISVEGSSSSIELRNNLIHNIESPNGNAHGIAFYGTKTTPMTNVVVEANEIRNCRLGQSESLVLNGNVSGFVVARNIVHDNDNIGIDFIGFEGTGPTGQDQARNGVCVDNVIYNISSASNPTYGGDRSADGIYVDGGRDIVIERNKVSDCDIGIEVASEHSGKTTSNITVRNNFVVRSYFGNILMGGYSSGRGNAQNVLVVHNTTAQGTSGEIILQWNCSDITIKNNVLNARSGEPYVFNDGGNHARITLDNNLYFGASTTSPGSWADPHSRFQNPLFVAPTDLRLQVGSPAIDKGVGLGTDASGQPLTGSLDIDGTPRSEGPATDLGAHEFGNAPVSTGPPGSTMATLALSAPSLVRGAATARYTLGAGARVSLQVLDVSGRVIESLVEGESRSAGSHDVLLSAHLWPAGCYFLHLTALGEARTRRVLVVR